MMTTFDFCDVTQTCGQRDVTTVPTQALALLNNQFVHDRSEALASAVESEVSERALQIRTIWEKVLGREPTAGETDLALKHLAEQTRRFEKRRREKSEQTPQQAIADTNALRESLVMHLRASEGVTIDAEGKVARWEDQSGEGHHAVQSESQRQPRLESDQFGGRSALMFDGQGQFLNLHGALLDAQECTIIAVASDRGESGHREILSNWNGAAGNSVTSLFLGLTGKDSVRFSDAFTIADGIADHSRLFLLTAVNSADRAVVYLNGGELAAREGPLPERNLSTAWVIGQQGNINGEFWNGGIAEIRVYARGLSDAERQSVEREILEHYAIPANVPPARKPLTPATLALASLAHVLLNSNEFIYVD